MNPDRLQKQDNFHINKRSRSATFHAFDGSVHPQSIFLDAGLQDLAEVPLSDHVLELDVAPLQGGVGQAGLRTLV